MTRELSLELYDGVYCEKVQREWQGRMVDWFKKTLCTAFVRGLVSGDPERIKVAITDKEPSLLGNGERLWVEIKVTRGGFYRWWWEFVDESLRRSNYTYGMYPAGEEILMSIFPNKFDDRDEKGRMKLPIFIKEDGHGVQEASLWIRIIVL